MRRVRRFYMEIEEEDGNVTVLDSEDVRGSVDFTRDEARSLTRMAVIADIPDSAMTGAAKHSARQTRRFSEYIARRTGGGWAIRSVVHHDHLWQRFIPDETVSRCGGDVEAATMLVLSMEEDPDEASPPTGDDDPGDPRTAEDRARPAC